MLVSRISIVSDPEYLELVENLLKIKDLDTRDFVLKEILRTGNAAVLRNSDDANKEIDLRSIGLAPA